MSEEADNEYKDLGVLWASVPLSWDWHSDWKVFVSSTVHSGVFTVHTVWGLCIWKAVLVFLYKCLANCVEWCKAFCAQILSDWLIIVWKMLVQAYNNYLASPTYCLLRYYIASWKTALLEHDIVLPKDYVITLEVGHISAAVFLDQVPFVVGPC